MADINSNTLVGGGGLPRLAPDLTFPSKLTNNAGYVTINLNPAGALTTALSLTGRHAIDLLSFHNALVELVTVKLTVDGVVIWNDTYSLTDDSIYLFGGTVLASAPSSMQCESSLLLEIETLTDTDVNFNYIARPIL